MPICPGCFEQTSETNGCPICGYPENARRSSLMLQQGTLLRNQYVIGTVLGNPGGFGITYLGYNQKLECKVAIKEFLPRELAGRGIDGVTVEVHAEKDSQVFAAGLTQFLREARLLAKFNHPNIVRVIDFFEENGTAYLIMDYYSGLTLVEYVEKLGGVLTEQAALAILTPIFDGLQEIHARGILHRDIKPQNIYITANGRPILLDFGAARHTVEALSQGFSLLITPGYAPVEQYDRQGNQGPWTDVYGCAATLYYMLTGRAPVDAISRMANDTFQPGADVQARSPGIKQALERGLALLPENRLQSIAEFRAYLLNETIRTATSKAAETQLLTTQPMLVFPPKATAVSDNDQTAELHLKPPSFPHTRRNVGVILLILILFAGVGIWYFQHAGHPVNQLAKRGIPFTDQAFFQAVNTDNQEIVHLFLAAGYQPNHSAADTGATALMSAIEAGQFPMVKYLITQGASLDVKDQQGRQPIDIALKQGSIQILKLLMDQKKLGPGSKDETGKTLLEKAISLGNMASVRFLIEQGASINAEDKQRNTLLDRMIADGNQQVAVLLKSMGAKRNINRAFARDSLNEIRIPSGDSASFEVDLLGNGIGQKVTISQPNFFSRGSMAISQEGRLLANFGNFKAHRWYAAYLRDENTLDLIHIYLTGSDSFIDEIRIIGKTGKDMIGVLFAPDPGMLRGVGLLRGQAGIKIEGKQLILYSGMNRAAVEWLPEQQVFRMRKI